MEEDLCLPPVEVSVVLNGKLLAAIKQVFRPMKWNWIVFLSAPGDISLPVDVITQQRYYSRHSSRRVSKQQLVLFDCKSKRCRRFSQIVLKLSLASFILQLLKKKTPYLVPQVNTASSVWRIWSTRSIRLVKAFGKPTIFSCLSSFLWLVTPPGIKLAFSKTWETQGSAVQTSTASSDSWTEQDQLPDGHSETTQRMLFLMS